MTTYHATELQAGTKCLICGSTNLTDSLLCGQCSAPLAIVHDVAAQEREPMIVSIIGESNVGKTVYLGFLLDMLAQRAGDFDGHHRRTEQVDH